MAMTKRYVSVELTTGEAYEDMRILYADRAAAERTFINRKWDLEKGNVKQSGFLAYLAAKRLGYYTGSWEDFEPMIADAMVEIDDGKDDTEDPTPAE